MLSDSRGYTGELVKTLMAKLGHEKQSMFVKKVTFSSMRGFSQS